MNIEVNTLSKAYASEKIEINSPVEKVYNLILNIKEWPKWLSGVTKVYISDNIQQGTEFVWKAKGYTIKSKIHTLEYNSSIGWTGTMLWLKAIHNWKFESKSENVTRVAVQESFDGFFSSFMANMLKKSMHEDLIKLKMAAENC